MKILIVDDSPESLGFLKRALERLEYEIVSELDSTYAIDRFKEEKPDLVILDVMMPNKSGHEVVKEIREETKGDWVPVLFLTGLDSNKDLAEGFKSGADDYLLKPVNLTLLDAKISVMQKIVSMKKIIELNADRLQELYDRLDEERRLSRVVMDKIIKDTSTLEDEYIEYFTKSVSEDFNGDILVTCKCREDNLCVMFGDVRGHGLSAAVLQLPSTSMFYDMAQESKPIVDIVTKINKTIYPLMSIGYFMSSSFLKLNYKEKEFEVWSGAMPPILHLNENGKLHSVIKAENPPLGSLKDEQIEAPKTYKWNEKGYLVLFTDGAFECKNEQEEYLGLRRFLKFFEEYQSNSIDIDVIKKYIYEFKGQREFTDDISIALIKLI